MSHLSRRASVDKSPFKTHCGAVPTVPQESDPGIVYIHIEPGESFHGFIPEKDFSARGRRNGNRAGEFLDLIVLSPNGVESISCDIGVR